MGFSNITLLLDHKTHAFAPGQNISGKVRFDVSGPTKIKGITLEFRGSSKVEYQTYRRKYSTKQYYIGQKRIQDLKDDQGNPLKLENGQYDYPFSFRLPEKLPSSFHFKNNRIQYEASLRIHTPNGSVKTKTVSITVLAPLDLNVIPSLKDPRHEKREEVFYKFLCWPKSIITLEVLVPFTGFVPGQNLPIVIKLNNNSKIPVDGIRVFLEKKLCLKYTESKAKTHLFQYSLLDVELQDRFASQSYTEIIKIPKDMEVNNFENCRNISERYLFIIVTTGATIQIKIPIKIGNIPLTE